jgi:hypothetical protein
MVEETMLEFAENLLHDIKVLRHDTEQLVISGSMKNMEQYSRMMGRLEGIRIIEEAIQNRLKRGNEDF